MKRKLVIVGDSAFAEIAYEYFTHDSDYEVAAFSVERDYLKREELFGLPIVAFEDLERLCPPDAHSVFVAVVFTQFNRLRARLYREAKSKGYAPASYVSTRAFVRGAKVGEHCFICEATVVHARAEIGDNVVLWSGNYVGHHAVIKSNCFTLPHVVVSERAQVGENCIIEANASLLAGVTVADNSRIAPGALVAEDVAARPAD